VGQCTSVCNRQSKIMLFYLVFSKNNLLRDPLQCEVHVAKFGSAIVV
jgi:hypothetical protein